MADIFPPREEDVDVGGSSGDFNPATGLWRMTIQDTFEQEIYVDENGNAGYGYVNTDGEVLSIQFGDLEPMNGQPEAGNQKFFQKFGIRDGDVDITSPEARDKDGEYDQINKAWRRLFSLSKALNRPFDTDFVEFLRNDEFKGRPVTVQIASRKGARSWTVKFLEAI